MEAVIGEGQGQQARARSSDVGVAEVLVSVDAPVTAAILRGQPFQELFVIEVRCDADGVDLDLPVVQGADLRQEEVRCTPRWPLSVSDVDQYSLLAVDLYGDLQGFLQIFFEVCPSLDLLALEKLSGGGLLSSVRFCRSPVSRVEFPLLMPPPRRGRSVYQSESRRRGQC